MIMMMRGILHLMQLLLCYHKIGKHPQHSVRLIIIIIAIILHVAQTTDRCTRSPAITSYSRPYEALMLTYNLTWRSAICNSASVIQYQIQVAGSCTTGSTQPLTILTGNNKTTALLVIPSCDTSCYLQIRAEMSDLSHTDYSSCVIIDSQLMEHQSAWLIHNTVMHNNMFDYFNKCRRN